MTRDWRQFCEALWSDPGTGFSLDLGEMGLSAEDFEAREGLVQKAIGAMAALEAGAVANPDEGRQVGHYWLRDPAMAPTPAVRAEIEDTREAVLAFAAAVHRGEISAEDGEAFDRFAVIGIGGSALGPLFVSRALGEVSAPMRAYFVDNTDPEGIEQTLARLGGPEGLKRTLTVVISKSGGTKETRNGMLEFEAAYARAGLSFARHAAAVTGAASELDRYAARQGWLARFPMWDWVGGRTSVCSAVGLLPAALEGIDARALLDGARALDALTRRAQTRANPAALLALAWHHAGHGRGDRAMVLLPYKDRLETLSRYLQQLVMESLGKALDRDGREVFQGLAVYGNKGSTDQHAYVQQLRDGRDDFFATFIEVLRDRSGPELEVEPGITTGDYLFGFLEGTRRALAERGRRSLTLTIPAVTAFTVGALIALFERAVGLYAAMVNLNAYHQPGVEAGKRAAGEVLALQTRVVEALKRTGEAMGVTALAAATGGEAESVFRIVRHLAANPHRGVAQVATGGPDEARWRALS
ncbi:MAG: glucose-6-phosphate isomerase [Myxococcales bacterium]|nr:glucose-6-phosphate isomerase [Myxococcales bacterium]